MKVWTRLLLVPVLVVAIWTAIEYFFLGTLHTAFTRMHPWWWYAGFGATYAVVSLTAEILLKKRAARK